MKQQSLGTDLLMLTGLGFLALAVLVGGVLYLALLGSLLIEHGPQAMSLAPRPSEGSAALFTGLLRDYAHPWLALPRRTPAINSSVFWILATALGFGIAAAATAICAAVVSRRGQSERSHGDSRWATRSDHRRIGRRASPTQLCPDGIVLGWLGRRVLQSFAEDNVLVFGVQRAGKTSCVVVPTLVAWSGTVVATSTKEELVRLTGRHRAAKAPAWVFAPVDRDYAWVEDLGLIHATWNPVLEAEDAARALEIAELFCSEGKQGPSAHWYLSASNLIAGLILSARDNSKDLRWVLAQLNNLSLANFVGLAAKQRDPVAKELLTAFANTPSREAGSIASTARSCLALWMDNRIAAATASANFDPSQLLESGGTLYLVAPAEEAERCRPLFTALLQSILAAATQRARRMPRGVLSPRLLLALDEVANFTRVPRLAGYAATGPGQGIQLLLCFHDLAQLEGAYGAEQARTIWNNCRARLLLPGQGDLRTLEQFSRAIGDETRDYELGSRSDDGRHSRSQQRVGRPLASIDALRRGKQPILLFASEPPAKLQARRWDQVKAWRQPIDPSHQDESWLRRLGLMPLSRIGLEVRRKVAPQ